MTEWREIGDAIVAQCRDPTDTVQIPQTVLTAILEKNTSTLTSTIAVMGRFLNCSPIQAERPLSINSASARNGKNIAPETV